MGNSSIRFTCFPRTEPPPSYVHELARLFEKHEGRIGTVQLNKGLESNEVLSAIRDDLIELGFEVEAGKHKSQKIYRPVFFGQNGVPVLTYEIDAYHEKWRCGLEVEAGRAWMGNAIYRDLVQALVMVQVETLVLAVPNIYKFKSGGKDSTSRDFENATNVVETLFSHSRFKFPYRLVVIGY